MLPLSVHIYDPTLPALLVTLVMQDLFVAHVHIVYPEDHAQYPIA